MKIAIVIQSRTGSSRLPGKIMMPLAGAPLLARMVERVRRAAAGAAVTTDVIVATTTDKSDDPVAALCAGIDTPCFRGHPTHLLDRHSQAGRAVNADVVVKIPSDCPLIDPGVI